MDNITTTILKNNIYCTVATASNAGEPWAAPVHFAYDTQNIYWVSQDSTVHSQNIEANGRVFITMFDSHQTPETLGDRGAVYISTHATKLSGDAEMAARDIYADRYPDDNNRKLSEWSVYAAPIGERDDSKTKGQLVYYRHQSEGSGA